MMPGLTRVHFIGICGTAMATLAALMRRKGVEVRGSDRDVYPPMSDFLASEGIVALNGFSAAHITSDLDLVVVGNAISRGNPELEELLDRKIRYRSLPETIRELFLWGVRSIVVTGTHGKTTTTSLVAWLLTHGGSDPSAFIGGIALNFGEGGSSYRLGGGREFVIEGDEYDSAFCDKTAKFLKYVPEIAVVNNVELDHVDIYAGLEPIRVAFRRLVTLVPRKGLLLLGADHAEAMALKTFACSPVETFGLTGGADWQAHAMQSSGFGTSFAVRHQGRSFGEFIVPLLGAHNIRNALAALAVGHAVGVSHGKLAEGLRSFRGVKRRLERIGTRRGVTVIDDFAHHPTAIAETLSGLRQASPAARIWAVFEPRSASSCRRVFQQAFARSFAAADEVVIAGVFRSTVALEERLSVDDLVADLIAAGQRARSVPEVPAIVAMLARECREGDLVVLMSNGGFGGIQALLLEALDDVAPGSAATGR